MEFQSPESIFEQLFFDLHLSGLWEDGKAITDAIPLRNPKVILEAYENEKKKTFFDLKTFFYLNFKHSESKANTFVSDTSQSVEEHIERLWTVLQREADTDVVGESLIPLPHPYIVPGGRFNEIYYWDSYFTMLGLKVSGKFDLIQSMIDNFAHLIELFGHIPNGNRTYFLSRSQPPFFACMLQLLAEEKGEEVLLEYGDVLEKEYAFWMDGAAGLSSQNNAAKHTVFVEDGILNRYFDAHPSPRAEMYRTDVEMVENIVEKKDFFHHVRAACESGWDFSARWFVDGNELKNIKAANFISVDLNCLLYNIEQTLARIFRMQKHTEKATHFEKKATKRKQLIQQYCWKEGLGFFTDYNFNLQAKSSFKSLAGLYPLFFKIASPEQAAKCAKIIEEKFLKAGGLSTTLVASGEQWDAPNGWAPLQWIAIQGLRNYGFNTLAEKIKIRWIKLNTEVFNRTGKLLEKYNVIDLSLTSGGGEYPVQDGFGWTNGVLLALLKEK